GRSAHGAVRLQGVRAIEKFHKLMKAIEAFEERRHNGFHHPLFARGELVAPISVGRGQAGDWASTPPGKLFSGGAAGIFSRGKTVRRPDSNLNMRSHRQQTTMTGFAGIHRVWNGLKDSSSRA